jgi:hypothetical protein
VGAMGKSETLQRGDALRDLLVPRIRGAPRPAAVPGADVCYRRGSRLVQRCEVALAASR